jgi:hypothetical protein
MIYCGKLFLRDVGDGLEYDGLKLAPTTQRKVAEAEKQKKSTSSHP